jgi:uncharacterized protein
MSRPPGLETDTIIDASVQAHARGRVERRFQAAQLPRLSEAGIGEPGEIEITIGFSIVDGHVALDGALNGFVTMACQRCMQPAKIDIADEFQLVLVDDEAERTRLEQEAGGGYEPIVADPARLDVRWLAEEQTLLSVPLVAKHADEDCANDAAAPAQREQATGQRPFANLRNMLRDR